MPNDSATKWSASFLASLTPARRKKFLASLALEIKVRSDLWWKKRAVSYKSLTRKVGLAGHVSL